MSDPSDAATTLADSRGLVLGPAALAVDEGGAAMTYGVSLSQPTNRIVDSGGTVSLDPQAQSGLIRGSCIWNVPIRFPILASPSR